MVVNKETDVQCPNPICFTCLEERAYFCQIIPELRRYHNYVCGGCFDAIMDQFQNKKNLPPFVCFKEDLEVEKMTESELGRIMDVPLPHPRKTEGKELCKMITSEMKEQFKRLSNQLCRNRLRKKY